MNGLIALVGSGEYLPVMDAIDRVLLDSVRVDGRTPKVACLPTAAGQEGNGSVDRWLSMGVEHFSALGADVTPVKVTNRSEADDSKLAEAVAGSDLIYFSGGNPQYLYQTMKGSKVWEAAESAWARGAVYAGCSAGAMVLGAHIPDFHSVCLRQQSAFGKLPHSVVFPHFDRMMKLKGLLLPLIQSRLLEGEYALGVDEETALVGKLGGEWQVMGKSKVYVITRKEVRSHSAGETVILPA